MCTCIDCPHIHTRISESSTKTKGFGAAFDAIFSPWDAHADVERSFKGLSFSVCVSPLNRTSRSWFDLTFSCMCTSEARNVRFYWIFWKKSTYRNERERERETHPDVWTMVSIICGNKENRCLLILIEKGRGGGKRDKQTSWKPMERLIGQRIINTCVNELDDHLCVDKKE